MNLSQGRTPWRTFWDKPLDPHDGKWCEDDALPSCKGCHGRGRIRDAEGDHLRILAERLGSGICGICGPVLIEWFKVETAGRKDEWWGTATPDKPKAD